MKLIQIIPLLIFVAVVSYLIGNHIHDRELKRDKFINRIRLNEHADKPHKELKRVTSPDGRVDAILAEIEVDSSNSNIPKGYAIYLVPVGEELELQSIYPNQIVFYATRITDLEFFWRNKEFLEISYTQGNIFEFRNNWYFGKELFVEIRIVPSKPAPHAEATDYTEAKAIEFAEKFIEQNGYTDLPPDKERLAGESLERESNVDEILKQRYNTLEHKAFGISRGGEDFPDGWTVVFKYKNVPDKESRKYGRGVTMGFDRSNARVEHEDFILAKVNKKL
ncbi:MAG: hypothetical protein WKF92_13145 [Pyrinomonadaceae bacterium]